MTESIRFGDLHFVNDCPMPEGKRCHSPKECGWDWACAIDRAMEKLGTDVIIVRREGPQGDYYVEAR